MDNYYADVAVLLAPPLSSVARAYLYSVLSALPLLLLQHNFCFCFSSVVAGVTFNLLLVMEGTLCSADFACLTFVWCNALYSSFYWY